MGDCGDLKVAKSFRKLMFLPLSFFENGFDIQLHIPDLHTGAWKEHSWMPSEFVIFLNKEGFLRCISVLLEESTSNSKVCWTKSNANDTINGTR